MSRRRCRVWPASNGAALALILQAGIGAAQQAGENEASLTVADAPSAQLPIAGYDGGFFLQSPDGTFRFTLGGLLQFRGTAFESGLDGRTSQFDLERMRFEFGGEFYDRYLFNVEPKFTESEVELEEAWIGADLGGPRLILGRMKEPFSLEEMLPRKHFDFPTFSILNQFVPAEDHGVTLLGGSLDAPVEYGAALYNGTGGDDLNNDKDVAARLVFRPWARQDETLLRRLQFGGAVTYGREESDLAGTELLTEAKAPFLAFEPGSRADGERLRLGLEAAWLAGPAAISAEVIHVDEELSGGGSDVQSDTVGWYVSSTWVLTGEEKSFRGVKPARPLTGSASGPGALQLALRYSELELDEALVDGGLVAASSFPDGDAPFPAHRLRAGHRDRRRLEGIGERRPAPVPGSFLRRAMAGSIARPERSTKTARRDRVLLTGAAFLRALATGMVGVLLGTYLPALGLSPARCGVIVSVGLAGMASGAVLAMFFADRIGRRRFLLASTLAMVAGGLLAVFVTGWAALLFAVFLGAMNGMGRDRGAGMILEQAALPATAPSERRTSAFAWYNVVQDAGHALGGLFAGLPSLLQRASGLEEHEAGRATLLLYPALLLPTLIFYSRLSPAVEVEERTRSQRLSASSRRVLWRISALFALDSLAGGFLTTALLSYFFFERFGASAGEIGLLFFFARILNMFSHLGASWLAGRIGLVNTMVFTHVPSSLLLLTVAFAPSFPVAAALFLLREGFVEMDVPTRQSYVLAVVRPEERTLASAATNIVRLLGWALAPLLAGSLMGGTGLCVPLVVGAGMKLAYDALLYVSFRKVRPPEEPSPLQLVRDAAMRTLITNPTALRAIRGLSASRGSPT
jgi:phosphate-selective porin/MFS family permease